MEFIGTCIGNPFDDVGVLTDIVENKSQKIGRRHFLSQCDIPEEVAIEMRNYPCDFEFFRSQVPFSKEKVFFYRHSAIEYFYM